MFRYQSDELTTGQLVSLDFFSSAVVTLAHLRSAVRRHVIAAPRTIKNATVTPQHIRATNQIDGRHRALALSVEEHDPAVRVRGRLEGRAIMEPQSQSDHRVIRPQRTDRSADHVLMKTSADRKRDKRENSDDESPLPLVLQHRYELVVPRRHPVVGLRRHSWHSFHHGRARDHAHPRV